MRKPVIALACAAVLALTACGSSAPSGSPSASGSSAPESATAASSEAVEDHPTQEVDFEGSAFEETGEGTMYLATAGGTSEDGNVPQVAFNGDPDNSVLQIEVDYWEGDGSVCTVYVDGIENMKMNAADVQMTLTLTGGALVEGVHTVEVVKMDGDTPAIYKKAQYEIVK